MRFGECLNEALVRKGMSQRAFSLIVRYRQQALNRVIRGERIPPLDRLDAWADALEGHVDREAFFELARLEHTPSEIRTALFKARAENVRLQTMLNSLSSN